MAYARAAIAAAGLDDHHIGGAVDVARDRREISSAAPWYARPAAAGRNIIVSIGIGHYLHRSRLANAVHDAIAVSQLFQRMGFAQVVAPLLDERATARAMQELVTDDLQGLGPDDSLVVFYAGHGTTQRHRLDDRWISTGYLVPVDAQDRVATWIDLEGWLRAIARLPPRHILVVLDACHSGIALDPVIQWREHGVRAMPVAALTARRSRRVITSALADEVACDGGPVPGHSLFTGCLIEALTHGIRPGAAGPVTGSELALYVQRRVGSYPDARQTPDFGAFALDDRGEMAIPIRAAGTTRDDAAPRDRRGIQTFLGIGGGRADRRRTLRGWRPVRRA